MDESNEPAETPKTRRLLKLSDAIGCAGFVLVNLGVGMVSAPLGVITTGLTLIGGGLLIEWVKQR